MNQKNKLKLWELSLLLGLALALLTASWAEGTQSRVAGQVLRLHVIANSDSGEDQALKLQVRDGVLLAAEELLADCHDRQEALAVLTNSTGVLRGAAEAVISAAGRSDPVSVTLEETRFPTKTYEGFALPAGEYTALRVVIGAGEGQNWWCVVFPPLCVGGESDPALEALNAGVSQGDTALMTDGYTLKFRTLELWGELKGLLEGLQSK